MEAKKIRSNEAVTKGLQNNTTKNKTTRRSKKLSKPAKKLLANDTKIKSRAKRTWCVMAHIGSGGFGDVYKVQDAAHPEFECAMKTEMHGARQRRLNIEKSILKEIDHYTNVNKKTRHFCELIDCGQTADYSWLAMTLIGPSLESVRRMLNRQFSKNCVVNMALQILDAVEIMHEVGFIHRDLKPGNICTGVPPKDDHMLYVLDFGISRRIFKNNKSRELRNKRERVPFYGTRKFCNRACHLEKDQGRKDDMETYVYTILDLFHNEKGLPWSKDLANPKKIVEKKKALFVNPTKELDPLIPATMARVINYLGGLKFHDTVDYRFVESELRSMRREKHDSSDESMDWTGKLEKLLQDSKKNPQKESTKGEETLMFERLQKARRGKDWSARNMKSGENETCTRTRDSEGPPGTFNERALTTHTTAISTDPPPKKMKPLETREKERKS